MTGVLGDNSKESSRMDDDVNGGLGMSGLLLPNSMKLKSSNCHGLSIKDLAFR